MPDSTAEAADSNNPSAARTAGQSQSLQNALQRSHRRLQRVLAEAVSPRRAFVDFARDPSRSMIVLGSARSGTTKLAEVLSGSGRCRIILEPLNKHQSRAAPSTFSWGQYLKPGQQHHELFTMWTRCIDGSLRSRWTDSHNTVRFPTRRIIKCVAGTNLAWWLRDEFPSTSVVFIVRHPFAVASSIESLYRAEVEQQARGRRVWESQVYEYVDEVVQQSPSPETPLSEWVRMSKDILDASQTPFERLVLRWCLENGLMLESKPPDCELIFFEPFFSNVPESIAALSERLELSLSSIGQLDRALQPSRSDFTTSVLGRRQTSAERITRWRDVLDDRRERAGLEILRSFGLDRYYGSAPGPLM